ncbi:hypothetical protein PLICRDRAFT_631627 [Plicaturopsis crispa FD-325 SS-3]|nr:hypothetical protein PLICRDRAFT_631627 [Plicaturopsis crispa FD-325 SS-3]
MLNTNFSKSAVCSSDLNLHVDDIVLVFALVVVLPSSPPIYIRASLINRRYLIAVALAGTFYDCILRSGSLHIFTSLCLFVL